MIMSVSSTKKHENLELIAAVRSDTILFDLPLAPTGKRGRPRIRGNRLNKATFNKNSFENLATIWYETN